MLDHDFVIRKIKLIQEDLARLDKMNITDERVFLSDDILQSAAERLLERIIMRALDINTHIIVEAGVGSEKIRGYEDTFYRLGDLGVLPKALIDKIAPSAGLRNRLVHEYDDINESIIFQSIQLALRQYVIYCQKILTYLEPPKA